VIKLVIAIVGVIGLVLLVRWTAGSGLGQW